MNKRKMIIILLIPIMALAVGALLMELWGHCKVYFTFLDPFPPSTPCPVPVCTPDSSGRRIAFSSNRSHFGHEIYVMNADGTCATRLTNFNNYDAAEEPHWSPDGSQILFQQSYVGSMPWLDADLYIMTADGSQVTRLTRRGGNWDGRWSPDGSKIAFLSNRDRGYLSEPDGYVALYVMDADGSHEMRLTDIDTEEHPSAEVAYEGGPAWSPSGTQIAFTGLHPAGDQSEVYTINVDGSSLTNLTNDPATDKLITWLPEDRILFVSNRMMDGQELWRLYIMDTDGTDLQPVIDLGRLDSSLDYRMTGWVPTSTLQLVLRRWGGEWLYVLDVECALENYTPRAGPASLPEGRYYRLREPYPQSLSIDPYWCPGSPQLTFHMVRRREDGADIAVMNFDGTGVTNLTNCSAYNTDPDWSP